MKRRVIMAVMRLCGEAVLLTFFAGIVVGVIGYLSQWDTSAPYSNALFIAGCLIMIGGAFSRLGAGQDWYFFQRLDAESFRDMSPSERASFIVDISSSVHLLILGLLTGILLILISTLVFYL